MTIKLGRTFLLTGAALLLAGQASAHRAWILPSSFTLSGDNQRITVDAAISNNLFYPNHHALSLEQLSVTAPDGSNVELEDASSGEYRSVFDVPLAQEGTYRIGSHGSGYFASWEEDGERRRWRGTEEELATENIADKPGVRVSKNNRTNVTFVTLGSPSQNAFTATGEGLELSSGTHPNDIYASESVSFTFTLDGEATEGVDVEIVRGHDRYRNSEGAMTLTTDADGKINFTPEEAGPYWLSAEVDGKAMLNGQEISSRTSYVMTFEALPF